MPSPAAWGPLVETGSGVSWAMLPETVFSASPTLPLASTVLRSRYGARLAMNGATINGLEVNGLAYIGRILNADSELDFGVQVKVVQISPLAGSQRVLSVYVGGGADQNHMPQGDDTDNLTKIGEVGMEGLGGWSSLLSIAKSLNLMPPVVDLYVKNDAGVRLPSFGHEVIALPMTSKWTPSQ